MSPSSRNDRSPGSARTASDSAPTRSSALKRELWGIVLLLFALFLGGALAAQGVALVRGGDVTQSFGWAGSLLAYPLARFLGWPAAALIPIALAAHALRLFGRLAERTDRSWMVFLLGLVVLLPVAIGLGEGGLREPTALSGLWGSFVSFYLLQFAGRAGAWIVVALSLSALMAATLSWNPIRAIVGRRADDPRENEEDTVDGMQPVSRRRSVAQTPSEPTPEEMPAIDLGLMNGAEPDDDFASARVDKRKREKKSKAEIATEQDDRIAAAIESTAGVHPADDELPSASILSSPSARGVADRRREQVQELDEMGVKLMDALRTFKVDGELRGRTTGPTVTQFEIEPAAGVKVRQFANLANDLALAMRAQSIRIVAPIPGKGAVGVEVPNPKPEMVAFREMLESEEYKEARALPIALGKNLEGRPVIADLAKMPHLLIAGATGSGKSVCINTLITSLIYHHTPETLRLLMVDPKMVELSVYNVLPHLRHKVVTDNRDAASVLKWARDEMQDRYELLAANGARNIQDFNRKVEQGATLRTPKRSDVAFENTEYAGGILPYIVLIIDELADLMMTVQAEIETPLAMLAQKARAIGIHIILATQRPSVNVLTG
ncbi:MAG: DNA translocase FtsK 4TM domain-containing protein, partial [Gemmatimonadales bacterium]